MLLYFQAARCVAASDSDVQVKTKGKGKAPMKGPSKRKASSEEVMVLSTKKPTVPDTVQELPAVDEDINPCCYEESSGEDDICEDLVDITQPGPSGLQRALGSMPLVPRTEMVDEKIRAKVRDGKFVEFKQLLPHPSGQKPKKRFALSEGYFEEVEDEAKISFYQWLDAYIILMSVSLEFNPSQAQGMLRHLQIVKQMHSAGKNAVEYDYKFRRLRSNHFGVQWGEYLAELANEIPSIKSQESKASYRKPDSRPQGRPRNGFPAFSTTRVGLCFKFNAPSGCARGKTCRYLHKCLQCYSFDHPQYRCSRQQARP